MIVTKIALSKKDYSWLPRDIKAGEIVKPFSGPTYGCISPKGAAYVFEHGEPFFELYHEWVQEIKPCPPQ